MTRAGPACSSRVPSTVPSSGSSSPGSDQVHPAGAGMDRLSKAFAVLLDRLMVAACLLLLGMTLLIGADVFTRNTGLGGIAWSNEVSESILYLLTLLSAPWLLRQGQHIRVDILLRAVPARFGWYLEWAG